VWIYFHKKINGLATPRRDPEGTPLTAVVLLLRLLKVVFPYRLTPRNVLDILSPNQKYNTKNVYGIIG